MKSRSRDESRSEASINLPRKNIKHTRDACLTFGLEPYYAFVCDRETKGVVVYLAPETIALEVCGANNAARATPAWPMKAAAEALYRNRRDVDWFDMATQESSAAFRAAIPAAASAVSFKKKETSQL